MILLLIDIDIDPNSETMQANNNASFNVFFVNLMFASREKQQNVFRCVACQSFVYHKDTNNKTSFKMLFVNLLFTTREQTTKSPFKLLFVNL
jgi:hypothetical protein